MANSTTCRMARGSVATVVAAALSGFGAPVASAVSVEANGVPLASGTHISAALSGTAVLTANGGSGTASCGRGSIGGVVGASGGASVPLTSPSLTLGPTTGSTHCFNSGLPILFRDFTLTSGALAVSASGLSVTGLKLSTHFTSGGLPGVCVFDIPSALGVINNVAHSVTFTNVSMTSTTGLCSAGSPMTLTAQFKPVQAVPSGDLVTVT